MTMTRAKRFELQVRRGFERVADCSVIRLFDPVGGAVGVRNICDFIVYKFPRQFFIECKSVQGNTLPFSNITESQWDGLLKMSEIRGVEAGILCWWVERDVTRYIPIQALEMRRVEGAKSVRYDDAMFRVVPGVKKRVFYEYNMEQFLEGMNSVRVR